MTNAPGIRGDAVAAWLAERLDLAAPLAFTAVGNGRSNLTYRASDRRGRAVIVRRPPLGTALESAHDVAREFRVLAALQPAGLPVPRPLALCEDAEVTGAPFYAMEVVDGVVPHDVAAVEGGLDGGARAATARTIPATLARLHAVDLDATGLRDAARGSGHAARQVRRWQRQWEGCRTRELPLVDALGTHLGEAIPPQPETTLVHGDYTTNNVVLDPGGDVRAVLDWELWTLGDPIADVAWLRIWWAADAARAPLGAPPPSAVAGMPPADALLAAYAGETGRDLDRLPFWTALSYWKLAVICEGVHRRWLDDPANGGNDAAAIGARVEVMARLAEEALG